MNNKKVYIGTLYVGENEIEECKESVSNQTFPNITHEVFSYLPNKVAHDTLYGKFMELQNEYDYFIKLDADMVLNRKTIIEELLAIFLNQSNLDHAVFSVHDWYSDSDIMGMHMFSNRVSWTISQEALFVDLDPIRDGNKIVVREAPSPVAMHSPNPSLEEAFMFGYHRALKVIQRDRVKKNTSQATFQFNLLTECWNKYNSDLDTRRLVVLYGAEIAFANGYSLIDKAKNHNLKNDINYVSEVHGSELFEIIRKKWFFYSVTYQYRKIVYIFMHKLLLSPLKIKDKLLKQFNKKEF